MLIIAALLTSIGVELFVFQTIMRWTLKQRGWQAALIKMALLTALWLIVTFVFATEIYLSMRGGPMKISWTIAAGSTFRDWFPWILLSPIAVLLAEKFRFERNTCRRSLIVHLTACFLFTVAYEGLVGMAYPEPFMVSTGGGAGIISATGPAPPGLPDANGFISTVRAGAPAISDSNTMFMERVGVSGYSIGSSWSVSMNSNVVTMAREGPLPFMPATNHGQFVVQSFRVNKTAQFLHLAMMRTQFTIPIYWCIVCICWVIGHFQEVAERERRTLELEARLTQANLQALKMQLQPHFLFNTLNAISSLIHENPKMADDMVGSLSQFLRTTLDVSSRNEIPLREELEFLDRYLEIQQIRFGERLKICRQIESAAINALVPSLILQPLVENAIRHGIESRESGGTVSILASQKNNFLHLEISDDGEGFSGGQLLRPGNGIGLSNTEARLQALYGDKQQFKLTANQPTGANVKIEIPFRLSQS